MPIQKQSYGHSQYPYVRNSKLIPKCAVVCVKYKWPVEGEGGSTRHKGQPVQPQFTRWSAGRRAVWLLC